MVDVTQRTEGCDVSVAQGVINWSLVGASGKVKFAFCKATQGAGYVDPQFKNNWAGIKAAGLLRGAYHFANTATDPTVQADHFVATVGDLDPSDMLVLDIEVTKLNGQDFINWVATWLERVEAKTGIRPIVYTGGPFFNQHGGPPNAATIQRLSRFPLWLAAYVTHPENFMPTIWKDLGWVIWQRSGDIAAPGDTILHVPGINGNVDRDQFKGTFDDMMAFALSLHASNQSVAPTPPVVEQPVPVPPPVDPTPPVEPPAPQPIEPVNPPVAVTPSGGNLITLILQFFANLFKPKS